MHRSRKRALWLVWGVLAVLAVTAPFNPIINQPEVLFPFYLGSAVVGLLVIATVIRTDDRQGPA